MISDAMWNRYRDIINQFHDDANQQDIVWKRTRRVRGRMGTDIERDSIILKGLIQYNYFRNWPINKVTSTGEVDKESMLLYFNLEYLRDLGYVNDNNQFDFDQGYDRFEIEGIPYKPMGDSKAAQAKDRTLLVFIILQREELDTTIETK